MNKIYFKWEEGPALQHHCGHCDRPLSHPGARKTCFGHHAEPCRRFHQIMFMKDRGHTCAACLQTDEAHFQRHREISEILRRIYQINDLQISLLPPSHDADAAHSTTIGNEDQPAVQAESVKMTKREKKTAKRATKAAQRPKVLTTAEIEYVGSVLHPHNDGDEDGTGPDNTEELEEIERNIRYNANVYNNGQKRGLIKGVVHISDYEVNFGVEIDRVLTTLRVSELVQKNSRNRGLRGKEHKAFETQVEEFKKSVVEDLVLLKKEDLETRMRRAAFLRYANRDTYMTLTERYENMDWATGERIREVDEGEAPMAVRDERKEEETEKPGLEEGGKEVEEHLLDKREHKDSLLEDAKAEGGQIGPLEA